MGHVRFLLLRIQIFRLVDKFLELSENFFANGDIDGRFVFIIVCKQVRIPGEQEFKTQLMTVLRTKMARSISISIFGIDVGAMLHESLDDAQISSQACNMKRRPKVVGPGVDLRPEFDQDLNERGVAFTCCQVQRSEPIRIRAINYLKQFVVLVELLFCIAEDSINFIGVTSIDLGPIIHLNLLNILLSLSLLTGLFGNLRSI